jgi:magnesium transporter
MFKYYTNIVKRGVVDRKGYWVGSPFDFKFSIDEAYPSLKALVISKGIFKRRYAVIPWNAVQKIDETIHLAAHVNEFTFTDSYFSDEEFTLKKDVLDKQVVDTYNRKIVRVNDIHLMQVGNQFRLVHVDVSFRGLLRRLGWEKIIDRVLKIISPSAKYLKRDGLISWKYVQPLSIHPVKGTIQLNVSMEDIHNIPPPDLSEMLVELETYQRMALYRSLDLETQVDSLKEMDEETQVELVSCVDTDRAIRVVENMPSDEATDLLHAMKRAHVDRILSKMNTKKAQKLSSLIAHEEDTAGGLMSTEMITVLDNVTVSDVIERIKTTNEQKDTYHYIYIIDDQNRLEGVISSYQLITNQPSTKVRDIMTQKPVSVHLNASDKEIAYLVDKYNYIALPVVDNKRVLHGIISMDDILELVIEEAWGEKGGLL